jgi:uncharacterized membrane protein YkvA (DUF1232 family)
MGFDQLGRLTLSPSEAIADAAQAFGQEDDITVVTIALQTWVNPLSDGRHACQ